MALENRYDFVMLFDVETEIQTEIRMRETLPELMWSPVWDMSRMCV